MATVGIAAKRAAKKAAAINSAMLVKRFKESVEGTQYNTIAFAMFEDALTTGIARSVAARRSTWAPLNPKYKRWKERAGLSTNIWEMTGGTMRAVTNNMPKEIGRTVRGLKFGINYRTDLVFAIPKAFKRRMTVRRASADGTKTRSRVQLAKGKFLKKVNKGDGVIVWEPVSNGEFQAGVLRRLTYGSRAFKLAAWAEKVGDPVSGWVGNEEARQPPRPFMVWSPEMIAAAAVRVGIAVQHMINGTYKG